jgi:hypothetical protein
MTGVAFDTLKLARRLRDKAGFTPEHAEEAAEALVEAIGGAELVTKTDLQIALRELEQHLIIKLGGMMIIAVGMIFAVLRFLPAIHS